LRFNSFPISLPQNKSSMRLWLVDPLTATPPLIPLYLQLEVKTVQTER